MATRFHSACERVNGKTLRAFQDDLVDWYRRNKRPLPWRRTRDPYKIWVSEVMLQQTRVEAVRTHYQNWISSFPTIDSLARAPSEKVLKHWEGLGYYSRARNLHRAAKLIARDHRGRLPRNSQQLRELPGIGRYTAGAIASIAFGERTPVVDGNVARVLARIFDIRANVKEPRTQKILWSLAEGLVLSRNPGEFNQALMELGALVCTPSRPRCEDCPMQQVCVARARGIAERLPNRGRKIKQTNVVLHAAFVHKGGKVLLCRRPSTGLLACFWELPALDAGYSRSQRKFTEIRHAITTRRITLRVYRCATREPIRSNGKLWWVTLKRLQQIPLASAHRRAVRQILSAQ